MFYKNAHCPDYNKRNAINIQRQKLKQQYYQENTSNLISRLYELIQYWNILKSYNEILAVFSFLHNDSS